MKRSAKRGLSWLLSLLMLVTMLPLGSVDTWAQETDETVPDGVAYIATKEELSAVRDDPAGQYVLTQDIVFTPDDFEEGGMFYNGGAGWEPIGTRDVPFTGTFDGNGHAIQGLTVTAASDQNHTYAGLFGYVSGTVQDIGQLTGTVMAENNGSFDVYAGSVAGLIDGGTVSGCYSDMTVMARSPEGKAYAGGITGGLQNGGTVTACQQGGMVQAETGDYDYSYAGGITGVMKYGAVSVCLNTGAVMAIASEQGTGDGVSYVYAGGIVGLFSSGTAENLIWDRYWRVVRGVILVG